MNAGSLIDRGHAPSPASDNDVASAAGVTRSSP
jgi:hypothetical protein